MNVTKIGGFMNTASDKIFLIVFTAFIAVVATASVVVAKHGDEISEAALPAQVVVSEPETVCHEPVRHFRKRKSTHGGSKGKRPGVDTNVNVVVNTPTMEQLEAFADRFSDKLADKLHAKYTYKPPVPRWKQVLSYARIPYDIFMKIPAGLQVAFVLYLALKYQPELLAYFAKEGVKFGVATGLDIASGVGSEVTQVTLDAAKKLLDVYGPADITQAIANTTQGYATSHAAWVEKNLAGFAQWLGY